MDALARLREIATDPDSPLELRARIARNLAGGFCERDDLPVEIRAVILELGELSIEPLVDDLLESIIDSPAKKLGPHSEKMIVPLIIEIGRPALPCLQTRLTVVNTRMEREDRAGFVAQLKKIIYAIESAESDSEK